MLNSETKAETRKGGRSAGLPSLRWRSPARAPNPLSQLLDFARDDFRGVDLRDDDLRDEDFDVRLRGVFSPFSRASLMPMAIACLRLVTLRPPRVLSVPCLRRRIALPTVELAFLLYFLPDDFLPDLRADVLCVGDLLPDRDDLRAAI